MHSYKGTHFQKIIIFLNSFTNENILAIESAAKRYSDSYMTLMYRLILQVKFKYTTFLR